MIQFSENLEPHSILDLLERSLPYYLDSWQDIDEQRGLFGTTNPRTFNMEKVGTSSPVIEYVVRPHLQILCCLASFVYHQRFNAEHRLKSTEDFSSYLQKGLQWAVDTHITGVLDVETFLQRKRWGENWRSGLWTSMLAIATHLSQDSLEPDLIDKVKRVLAFEADRFIGVTPPTGCEVDTKLEENAQDTLVLAWAINMLPDHENVPLWNQSLQSWSLNIATSIQDLADHTEYFGSSISKSVRTQTLFPDMTAENHGFFHPLILSYSSWVVLAMAAYQFNDQTPPSLFMRKHHQQTFDILLRFCLPTGMLFEPSGQDLPLFVPHPFAFAWGIWNNDPRAFRMTAKLLTWMDWLSSVDGQAKGQWVLGFEAFHEGWELLFQSQVGFELAMLAVFPFQKDVRFYSSGQIESAVDTRRIFHYIQVCYRRNTRTTRSVAWKAIGNHPTVTVSLHNTPELITTYKAQMLGIPLVKDTNLQWEVLFHEDRFQRDGFDTFGRIMYRDRKGSPLLSRDLRILCWGDDGIIVLDRIKAMAEVSFDEQYLSPLYLVNDYWTDNKLSFTSGSLKETFIAREKSNREISCPSFWASVENQLLLQFVWGRTKGLVYLPGGERNAPAYWKNCRLDMLAVRAEAKDAQPGDIVYQTGMYLGIGKGPRPFKSAGNAGEFFRGLVIMDGKNTLGLS